MSLQSRLQAGRPDDPREPREEPQRDFSGPSTAAPGSTDPFGELKTRIHHDIITRIGPRLFNATSDDHELAERVGEAVAEALALDKTPLTRQERAQVTREITDDILGYGPLEPFLRDDTITEVMVNNYHTIFIERRGKITATNAQFADDQHLLRIIDKIISRIGRRVDEASPMVDARLPDGSRVNAIIPPLAVRGPALTIRKFRKDPFQMEDLLRFGTLTPKCGQFLEACVRGKLNVLISGGTGSGKTTTLNVLSTAIPNDERIITVEDAAELQLRQEHVITLETRPSNIEGKGQVSIRDLVRNCLRMRPDRIIVGECRGGEAVDMLQAMNTGHDGSLTTVHANSPRDAMSRVETLVLTAGVELPMRAIREQIASAFDLVVQVNRLVDGSRRITHVTEVLRMESDMITMQDIFVAKPVEDHKEAGAGNRLLGSLRCTGIKPQFLNKMAGNGVNLPANFFQLEAAGGAGGGPGYSAFGRAQGPTVTTALRRGVATLVALVALLVLVPAALAADGITLRSLDTSRLPEVRAVVALDEVDPDQPPVFRVLENDAQVGSVEVGSAATATSYALVVDTSQSMKGRALRSAMEGAKTFLATVKDGDRVALIGFGAAVLERQPFTDDQTALDNAVDGLVIDAVQGTALEDAVITGARALASEDPKRRRVMIVLTDGDNVVRTSAATEEQALDTTKKAQVTAYTIGVASDDFAPAALQRLAAATGGTYGEGTTKELSTVYAQIAQDLARTFVLTFYSSHSGKVALTIDAGGNYIARTNYAGGAPVRVKTGEGVVPSSVTHANWSVPALAGATLLLFVIGGFTVLRPRPRKTLTQRLEPYADSRTRALKVGDVDGPSNARGMLKSFAVVTERLLGQLKVWKRMATTIERADLPLKTAELFYMMVGAALFLGFVVGLGFGLPMPVTLAVMAIGFLLPYGFVKLKARQRCKAFDNQLPDILIAMAASLKAGHSFNQAMETTIKEGADPAAKEFGRVSNEIRLGRASDEALERMAERLGSSNFRFVVMAVNVQRQVGGSMAELLDGVGETVRQRQQFLRKVKALCAMGRMSAYTLIALPIMMGGAISAINPSYMKPLFVTSTGHMLLVIAVVSISFGAIVLKKIVSFRV